MKPLTNFLLFTAIGLALYFILFSRRKHLSFAFQLFFLVGPTSVFIVYALSLIQAVTNTVPPLLKVISTGAAWMGLASLVILGYCLGYFVGWAYSSEEDPYMPDRSRSCSYIIQGLSIQVGLTFLTAAIGKYLNMVNMKDFFISSGYSVSFLYFIMTIESVFGLLLLFNLKFYLKILSLLLLFSVMAGAIVTHARNGDPLSDSVAAIVLGLKIILVSVIYLFNKKYLLKKAVPL